MLPRKSYFAESILIYFASQEIVSIAKSFSFHQRFEFKIEMETHPQIDQRIETAIEFRFSRPHAIHGVQI